MMMKRTEVAGMKMPFSTWVRRWSSEATGEPARVMGNFSEIIKLIFYVIERELS